MAKPDLLAITGFASKRTKNRVTEHRLLPIRVAKAECFGGVESVLAVCVCHEEPWMGWFPRFEVMW